jgi:predicted GNAT family acetyltransferase
LPRKQAGSLTFVNIKGTMQVVNNKKAFRYEIAFENGETAYLEYRWRKGDMLLMHTLVPKDQRGKGYAAELVQHVFEDLRERGIKAVAYCPYVIAYLEKHPEYCELIRPA